MRRLPFDSPQMQVLFRDGTKSKMAVVRGRKKLVGDQNCDGWKTFVKFVWGQENNNNT